MAGTRAFFPASLAKLTTGPPNPSGTDIAMDGLIQQSRFSRDRRKGEQSLGRGGESQREILRMSEMMASLELVCSLSK